MLSFGVQYRTIAGKGESFVRDYFYVVEVVPNRLLQIPPDAVVESKASRIKSCVVVIDLLLVSKSKRATKTILLLFIITSDIKICLNIFFCDNLFQNFPYKAILEYMYTYCKIEGVL